MKTFKQLRESTTLHETTLELDELTTKIEQLHKKAFPKSWFKIKKSNFGGNAAVGIHFGIVPESEVPNKILDNDPGHHRFMIFVRGEDDYEVKVTLGSIYIVPEKGVNLEMQGVKTKFRKVKGNSAKVLKAFTTFFPRMKKIVTDNADNIYGGDRYSKGIFESVDLLEFGLKPSELKKYPALVAVKKEIDALLHKNRKHQYLPRKEADKLDKLEKKEKQIIQDLGLDDPSYKRAMTDSVNEASAVELASKKIQVSNKHEIAFGKFKDGVAVIEQKGAKNKWQVVFAADSSDLNEFSKGLSSSTVLCRLQTPLSKPGSWEHRTICAIEPMKGTIAFLDMDKYEEDNVVKWEKGVKFTFLNILDTKLDYFDLK